MSDEQDNQARRILISGHVQGVGFRPFVYRLAQRLDITGNVQNRSGDLIILAQGKAAALARFERALLDDAPAIARPQLQDSQSVPANGAQRFEILPSASHAVAAIHLPPDYFTCPDCLAEMTAPGNRRYRYPFTNCTQCGPRYTLIRALPYDRPNTSMADFPLCPACQAEYEDPADRRFHAEPIACPECGPTLFMAHAGQQLTAEAALQQAIALLDQGETVAVQGIGGFHLLCDATSKTAIAALRRRKARPDKPLAVLFPDPDNDPADWLAKNCHYDGNELAALTAPARPILLLTRRPDSSLPLNLAPGLNEIGALLPYSPLHHLLLQDFGRPLVATSGNISGEPVLTDAEEARQRLAAVTPHILWHNRPIVRPADDSVLRTIQGQPRPLRLGRGTAPLETPLPFTLDEPVLAVGAHMKLTVALAWQDRLVVSPHIADMGSRRSQQVFAQVIDDLQRLYQVEAQHLLCDRHPGYATTRWARQQGLPSTAIAHHHAHAAALYGEYQCQDDILVFTWDGTGLGTDNTLWGGETFYGHPGHWQHVAQLRPYRLPGGDKVARRPWQSAAALCWEAGIAPPSFSITSDALSLTHNAWQQQLNTVQSSSIGRVFDAVSALLGIAEECSFDGQAPMQLEALAQQASGRPGHIALHPQDDRLQLDWRPWLPGLMDGSREPAQRAADFHATLAQAIVTISQQLQNRYPLRRVGLCGGVFQNRLLTEQATRLLQQAGFEVLIPARLPCNDAAISIGQIMEYGYQQQSGKIYAS